MSTFDGGLFDEFLFDEYDRVIKFSSDVIEVGISGSSEFDISEFASSDSLATGISETSLVELELESFDTLAVGVRGFVGVIIVGLDSSDSIAIGISEASGLMVVIDGADSLATGITETSAVLASNRLPTVGVGRIVNWSRLS